MKRNKQEPKLTRLMDSPGGLQKIAESMLAPLKRSLVYDKGLRTILDSMSIKCVKCKRPRAQHTDRQNHPWLRDNLEHLAWKYATKDH